MEAYKVFDELFGPIIRDLHPQFDMKYAFKYDFEAASLAPLARLKQVAANI